MVDMTQDSKILAIDAKIKASLQEEIESVNIFKSKLNSLQSLLNIRNLSKSSIDKIHNNIAKLKDRIENAETRKIIDYYTLETSELIEKYKKILKTPISVSFSGKQPVSDDNLTIKMSLINDYMKISKKYLSDSDSESDYDTPTVSKKNKHQCTECKKKTFDVVDGTTYICIECGAQQEVHSATISFKDIDRVNISAKFTYERLIHFRDCINQYQGKQNTTIDPVVYKSLEEQFERHHLLVGDKNTPNKIKFKNITKDHISIFLKDLRYTRHYENINLIHYVLTEIPPDDISHLENKLMDDFIVLTELYNKYKQEHKIPRKSFINSQYVLFQLLNRHKHHCKREDFNILKTIDRQYFHDEVTKDLFQELGWNMIFLV